MFKRLCLLLVGSVFGIQPADAMFRSMRLFRCEDDRRQHEAMRVWTTGDDVARLRATRSLKAHNAEFTAFLNTFVSSDDVRAVLEARVYRDRLSAPTDVERAALKVALLDWYKAFNVVLARYGSVIASDVAEFPGTITFSFPDFPQYDVRCRAWNQFPLGFYSTPDGLSKDRYCNPCGPHVASLYPFPAQLTSRLLYAEKIEACVSAMGVVNVAAAEKYVYEFPGDVEELDDHNLFIIADHVNFDPSFHDAEVARLKAAYADISVEGLRLMTADGSDHSLLANIVRVVCAAGLWELNVKFVVGLDGQAVAVLEHTQRPAFGGGEPMNFFHKDLEVEVASNVCVGLAWIADWLKSSDASAGAAGGAGAGAE